MMKPLWRLLWLSVAATGCVGQHQYWKVGQSVRYETLEGWQFDPRQDDSSWPYHLAFVEFDERGEFFDRRQLDSALTTITTARNRVAVMRAGLDSAKADSIRATVVVFVHGWKHNASEKSANVWGFRQVLAGLSLQTSSPVVGIYVGWRGATLTPPILKEFTFFDRHQKSQALPNAHLVESLTAIMQTAKTGGAAGVPTAKMVLFGHSFGGAVLESALTQTFAGLVARSDNVRTITWPADLVVYVNQAQEADRSYQLIEALHAKGQPRDGMNACLSTSTIKPDGPAIISMSSTADYATGAAFPIGKAFIRPFQTLRTYDEPNFLGIKGQGKMFFNPTAHLTEFHSHLIGAVGDPTVEMARSKCHTYLEVGVLGKQYAIVEKPGAANRTPYWVMSVPPSLIPDHGTIFTPAFRNLIVGFLAARQIYEK